MDVHIDVCDGDTVILRHVPVATDRFNKPHTNVLIKRQREGLPFVVFVDDDLEYVGEAAPSLAALFASGPTRDGWRVIFLERHTDLQAILDRTLTALGVEGYPPDGGDAGTPEAAADGQRGLLRLFGTHWSQLTRDADAEPTVGRDELIDEVVATVLRWSQQRLCLIVGESGVGKTNLLAGVARRLAGTRRPLELVSVSLGEAFAGTWLDAERENLLRKLLAEAAQPPKPVLALEHLELVLSIPHGPLLLTQSLDTGVHLVGTTLPRHLASFHRDPLMRRLHVAEMQAPGPAEALAILEVIGQRVAAHHSIEIDASCIPVAIRIATPLLGHFPAKAVALLDAAASAAMLAGAGRLAPDDLCRAAARMLGAGRPPLG